MKATKKQILAILKRQENRAVAAEFCAAEAAERAARDAWIAAKSRLKIAQSAAQMAIDAANKQED